MIDMVVDTGVFLAVNSSHGAYHQLSGKKLLCLLAYIQLTTATGYPLSELQCLTGHKPVDPHSVKAHPLNHKEPRLPSNINFVRNRMMYARAALNAQGGVRFGLRHIREFNMAFLFAG